MKPAHKVFVVGGAHSAYLGKGSPRWANRAQQAAGAVNPTLEQHLSTAVRAVLQQTGVPAEAVDRGVVANFLGECFARQGHLGAMLAGVDPGLDGLACARIEAACASGGAAVVSAAEALQAGHEVALVVGVEVETNARGRDGVDYLARAADIRQADALEPNTFPYLFALRAQAYKHRFGAVHEDVVAVARKAYHNARLNPLAQMYEAGLDEATISTVNEHNPEFLQSPELRPHMRLLESTTFTDGASAVLLASERGLAKLGIDKAQCTELCAWGQSSAPLSGEVDPARMSNMARAARRAYADAGVTPAEVRLAELHDCFAITELLLYEALGFAAEGQGMRLVREGRTRLDGDLPVNTGGGLLGFGHPVGASGVKQVAEVHRQLHGQCGAYQVPGQPELAVTANLGGDDRTGVVMVFRPAA